MTTKATDPVINLVSPACSNMVLLMGTLNNVNIGLSVPGPAVFTTTQIDSGLVVPYIPQYSVMMGTGTTPIDGISPGAAGYPLISNGPTAYATFGALNAAAIGGILPV